MNDKVMLIIIGVLIVGLMTMVFLYAFPEMQTDSASHSMGMVTDCWMYENGTTVCNETMVIE